jgi:predicted GNAT family N-acyltransferase
MNAIVGRLRAVEAVTGFVPEIVPDVSIDVARTLNDLMEVMTVRALVYIAGQSCPYDEEFDGNDFTAATHLIARLGSEPVAVMRIRWFPGFAKFERVAVRSEHRGGAIVRQMVNAGFDLAARKGYRKVLGHVQARLLPFWERSGGLRARPGRPHFTFSDHEYIEVERDLVPPPDALNEDTDPLVLLRPEGQWDRPGVLDRSATRPATCPLA